MGLKAQLAVVAAISLLLPWAGCEYIGETEVALRQTQQRLLEASARAIAAGLSDAASALGTDVDESPGRIYLARLDVRPVLDGFAAEWTPAVPAIEPIQGSAKILFSAAEFEGLAYVLIESNRPDATLFGLSATNSGGSNVTYLFSAAAPGPLIANVRTAGAGSIAEPRLQGYWEETRDGPHLELQMPLALVRRGLGLFAEAADGKRLAISWESILPPPPITRLDPIQRIIDRYQQPGVRVHVVDRAGWIRAAGGSLGGLELEDEASEHSIIGRLYRRLLRNLDHAGQLVPLERGRDDNAYVRQALLGTATNVWLGDAGVSGSAAIVGAAVPVRDARGVHGAVVMHQNSATLLILTSEALSRLGLLTLAATFGTALILLAYASWLSFRVRRLSRAADHAMDARGQLTTSLPESGAGDEIGSLSRSFSTLLGRVRDYNDYLKALAGRLSHELRTPMTVVSSSLDNLEAGPLSDAQQEYALRAREGIGRLQRLVRAMSEATRIEQAAADAARETFDLDALLETTLAGYRNAYPQHRFNFVKGPEPSPFTGAPELLVQLLDKLIENAVSFTEPGGTVSVGLERVGPRYELSVTNPGPPLPDAMRRSLFDSLVSVRVASADEHMGFGLYIARLIAEAHSGRLRAENLDVGSGVRFTLELPV